MRSVLDPTLDVVFKLLFAHPSNKDLLLSLLTAVLHPRTPIVEATVLNPEVAREAVADKGIVLDVLVELADGSKVGVEMQADKRPAFRSRALYYWARVFGGQIAVGEAYTEIMPVVLVVFLSYSELPGDRLHSVFEVLETTSHERFSEALQIHAVELPKLGMMSGEEKRTEPDLVRWSRFLTAETDEDLAVLGREEPIMEKATGALRTLSADDRARMLAEERTRAMLTYKIEMAAARREGRDEGRAEGEAAGLAEAVLGVLATRGVDVSDRVRDLVMSRTDPAVLRSYLARAVRVHSAEELFAGEEEPPKSNP